MNLLRVLICVCLLIRARCVNDQEPAVDDKEPEVDEHGTSQTGSLETKESSASESEISQSSSTSSSDEYVTDTAHPGTLEVSSTKSHTDEEETTATLDTSNDTKITASEDSTTIVTLPKTTVYEDDSAETNVNTTSVDEDNLEPEINKTACSLNPCRNGGTCVEDLDDDSLFSCTCPKGFVGLRCGTEDRCEADDNGDLCKDGDCFYAKNDSVRFCRCFQDMHWDEKNKMCRDSDLPCFPNPCWNGGTCFVEDNAAQCNCLPGFEGQNCSVHNKCGECEKGTCLLDSTHTIKYCKCFKGLYWDEEQKTCEAISLPCHPNPCGNDGSCLPLSDTEFNCSCIEGFSGSFCEVIDHCGADKDCGGHGSCSLDEDERQRRCKCDEGFYLEEISQICDEIIKPCRPNPCYHDGVCIRLTENTPSCICSPGYTGATCAIRDRCEMDGGKGFCAEANCTDMQVLDLYYCTCGDGQYFDYTKRKCVELDMCALVQCNLGEKCSSGICKCMDDYQWDNSTNKCEPNICSTHPCPAFDMICEEGSGRMDYKCSCKEGYAFDGTHCSEVLCTFPSLNKCDQHCLVTDDGFKCDCHEGFDLQENNRTCVYVGNSTCSNNTCDHGSCIVEDGEETCICSAGYTAVDGKCVDICTAGHLPQAVCPLNQCVPRPDDGYQCKCEGKYAYSKDQTTCEVRNVCREDEVGGKSCAEKNAKCVRNWEKDEGFECVCPKGLIETPAGCRDICSLESNQRKCALKGAVSDVDVEGEMFCRCPPYFQANTQDGTCSQPADNSYLVTLPLDRQSYQLRNRNRRSLDTDLDFRKILQDVTLTAQTMFTGFNRANILSCSTTSEHTICRIELQFRSIEVSDLNRLKVDNMCLDNGDSEKCLLPPSLVLVKGRMSKDVQILPTDPCDVDIKVDACGSETTCTSSPQNTRHFNCSCKPGFSIRGKIYPFASTRSIIQTCKDIDECLEGDPCPANSDCINNIGSYLCTCKPGYRSVEESSSVQCIELCNPSPCTHGACSPRGDHEFDCTCDVGYRGALCNLQDKNFKDAKINTVIVGVVLGGILLITLILSAVCISRLKKKKYLEDSGNGMYQSAEMTERRRVVGGAINNAYQRE